MPEYIKEAGKGKRKMKKCFFGSAGTLRSCVSCLQRVQILLLCVSLPSCHCSGQKSAQTSIVLHPDLLPLQAALPDIAALCHVFKIQCHPSAMIRGSGVKTTLISLNCLQLPPFFWGTKKGKQNGPCPSSFKLTGP